MQFFILMQALRLDVMDGVWTELSCVSCSLYWSVCSVLCILFSIIVQCTLCSAHGSVFSMQRILRSVKHKFTSCIVCSVHIVQFAVFHLTLLATISQSFAKLTEATKQW